MFGDTGTMFVSAASGCARQSLEKLVHALWVERIDNGFCLISGAMRRVRRRAKQK